MIDKKAQGKRNKRKGSMFEMAVRKDLESKGWIVSKWQNNVEFEIKEFLPPNFTGTQIIGHLVPAKHKFNPFRKAMALGTGFPDYICFRRLKHIKTIHVKLGDENTIVGEDDITFIETMLNGYEVIGVEAKTNGYLDKEEKAKCQWLIGNKIFSKILIAKKNGKEIVYTAWK